MWKEFVGGEELQHVLEVENLKVSFETDKGKITPVENISFSLQEGETISIVGESGCGKSITSLAIMRLLAQNGSIDRKSTRLNSSHVAISYAVFCLKKKTIKIGSS